MAQHHGHVVRLQCCVILFPYKANCVLLFHWIQIKVGYSIVHGAKDCLSFTCGFGATFATRESHLCRALWAALALQVRLVLSQHTVYSQINNGSKKADWNAMCGRSFSFVVLPKPLYTDTGVIRICCGLSSGELRPSILFDNIDSSLATVAHSCSYLFWSIRTSVTLPQRPNMFYCSFPVMNIVWDHMTSKRRTGRSYAGCS